MRYIDRNVPIVGLLLSGLLVISSPALAENNDLFEQAQQAQEQGDYLQAEQLWQQLLRHRPASAEIYYNLGVSFHHQLKLPEAIAAYQNATRLAPDYSAAYLNLGLAWIETGEYNQAMTTFERVLALPDQPSNPVSTHALAYYDLAIVLKRQGKAEAALQQVQQSLTLAPGFQAAQQLLQQLQP